MQQPKPTGQDVLSILQERGFIAQVTDAEALRSVLHTQQIAVYTGYDPTADSLHVGNLVTLMALKHLQLAGHQPIILIGGGTALIGDPSGKSEMRPMLTADTIARHGSKIATQAVRFLNAAAGKSLMVNNADWLTPLHYITFLRDVGRHFSVNRMLSMEAYKQRLAQGLSFIEFNYQLLQAYDFCELRKRFDCQLQIGGDDQWGNIIAGVDLCRRMQQQLVFGLTIPLLTTATGAKMGKTAAGAVWLDAEKVAPYDYYQYWVNCHDNDVKRMLALFTFLPMDEIRGINDHDAAVINAAKNILAFETTALLHGIDAANTAHVAAMAAFKHRIIADDLLPSSSIPRRVASNEADIPTTLITPEALQAGLLLVDALLQTGLCASKNEARRLIQQNAIRCGEYVINDVNHVILAATLQAKPLVIRAGKKRVHQLVLQTT